MSEYGVADYPHKELLEELWKSGLRAKAILEYLEENNLPTVSYKALSKYGQRNWSDPKVEELEVDENVEDVDTLITSLKNYDIGEIKRISVSKTGYSVSVEPKRVIDHEEEIKSLSKASRSRSKRSVPSNSPTVHVVIPDTQIEPGRPTEHLHWASNHLKAELFGNFENVKVIHLGDHWNMGSLSSYDRGKGTMEGRRYLADIESGNEAFEMIDLPETWHKHFLFGNHENRVNKAVDADIQLEGLLTTDHMLTPGWERHNFLDIVELDGVSYSHYFYNPNTSKSYGGDNLDLRLKVIGRSFVMGHQQGLKFSQRYIGERQQFGIAAGSFYMHEEPYMGPQATGYWRGIVILRNVENGSCEDIEFISLKTLERLYG